MRLMGGVLPFAVLAVAACSGQPPQPWQRPDHTLPTAGETSACHEEARHRAGVIYPDREPNDAIGRPRLEDERRFPTEIRLFEACMTRLGYVRANAAPAR